MSLIVWHQAISQARSRRELLAVMRDYVARWSPEEWARIPRSCRPERIKDLDDIQHWFRCLADEWVGGGAVSAEADAIRDLLALFMSAADRARELQMSTPAEDPQLDMLARGAMYRPGTPASSGRGLGGE